jgi:hypothetical protein
MGSVARLRYACITIVEAPGKKKKMKTMEKTRRDKERNNQDKAN